MIKLIIFDFDGIIVNSQPLQYKSYRITLKKYGYDLTPNDWQEWVQNSYDGLTWMNKNGVTHNKQKIKEEKEALLQSLIPLELKLMPGAKEIIAKLKEKYPLAIASHTREETIKVALRKFDLLSCFKLILSDQKVARGKPYPDVYLEVAKRMNIRPQNCLVFEDSLAGIKAAKAAGMICIAIPDSFTSPSSENFIQADLVIKSFEHFSFSNLKNF